MASIEVICNVLGREIDPLAPLGMDDHSDDCVLVGEHAASSYGLPVLVGPDGRVYGPGDLPDGAGLAAGQVNDAGEALVRAARLAGYNITAHRVRHHPSGWDYEVAI